MISKIYQNLVLSKPKIILSLLIVIAIFFGYKSKDFSNLDSGPCKNKNEIVEYVDYNPQFQEMGLGGTDELKNGFPAGSKQVKKYGLKNYQS